MERALLRFNRARPEDERFHFSYGIGYGEVLDLEDDVFGLEVNLASKLGEDLARPGQVLLTPAAAAGLDAASQGDVVPYKVVVFKGMAVAVQQLRRVRPT
jgi:class 3 adenylate cyclase